MNDHILYKQALCDKKQVTCFSILPLFTFPVNLSKLGLGPPQEAINRRPVSLS